MTDALRTVCWLAQFDHKARPCRLPFDRVHLIPKQWIRRQGRIDGLDGAEIITLLFDPRILVDGCRQHHGNLDFGGPGKIIIPRAALPVEAEEYAADHGWEWMLDRLYPR